MSVFQSNKPLTIVKMIRGFMYLLPWKDSNPHRRNQNPTCYHYTTRQSVQLKSAYFNAFLSEEKQPLLLTGVVVSL